MGEGGGREEERGGERGDGGVGRKRRSGEGGDRVEREERPRMGMRWLVYKRCTLYYSLHCFYR